MWTLNRAILIVALLASSTLARSDDGISFNMVGQTQGISFSGAPSAPPATPCSGTGLIFNVACNSQYIGII